MALMDKETFKKSLLGKVNPGTPPKRVVRIAPGSPVPAFSASEIEVCADKKHVSVYGRWTKRLPSHPICMVPPGAFFLIDEKEWSFHYRWAPVRCGDQVAYVAWDKTMVDATVVPVGQGAYHLIQVVDMAMEDEPVYKEWLFDESGRHPLPRGLPRSQRRALQLESGRCPR